ncbi:hypothetical protein K502DRAFT_324197 [Neoconidiobolus thromboides FSU 785]|nr:hypothetical protein K502DRAFT_324197 [Neoconidiobolus thromboides FSU 785]
MARSLRSKIKRKHESVRREKIYKPIEDERIRRLAAKQAEGTSFEGKEGPTEIIEEEPLDPKEQRKEIMKNISSKIVRKEAAMNKFFEKQKQKKLTKGNSSEMGDEETDIKIVNKPKKKLSAKAKLKW